jgi:hypothetical protein
LNFLLWILFVLDYLLLEITTPLIIYIWRRHGGTCKFEFEFYWDVKHLFYNNVTTYLASFLLIVNKISWGCSNRSDRSNPNFMKNIWIDVDFMFSDVWYLTRKVWFGVKSRCYYVVTIITLLPFFIEMLQYDRIWSGHIIIKEMFYIPIKLKLEISTFLFKDRFIWELNAFFCSFIGV